MTFQNQKLGDVPSSIILNMMKKEKEKLGERTKIKNWNIILKFERKSARTVHTMYFQKLLYTVHGLFIRKLGVLHQSIVL